MKRYLSYLKYVIRHKYHVFVAGRRLHIPIWRLLVHDLSKFLPSEFIPYAHTFYDANGKPQYKPHVDFERAWGKHQKRNGHHPQAWVNISDSGKVEALEMEFIYIQEMVADLFAMKAADPAVALGAGKYFLKICDGAIIHPKSKAQVISTLVYYGEITDDDVREHYPDWVT